MRDFVDGLRYDMDVIIYISTCFKSLSRMPRKRMPLRLCPRYFLERVHAQNVKNIWATPRHTAASVILRICRNIPRFRDYAVTVLNYFQAYMLVKNCAGTFGTAVVSPMCLTD